MNIELKPIAESKVRQLGGDVCGVLVRTDGEVMAVSEHGRCTRLDAGVMGPVEPAGMNDTRNEFERIMANQAVLSWSDSMSEYPSVVTQKMWEVWQAARAQGGQGAEVVAWCWENHGRHVTVDKSFAKELIADGEIVRPLVYGDTEPRPAVPEAKDIIDRVVAELETGFVRCERCGDQEDTATLDCMTDLKRLKAILSTPTTAQADEWVRCEDRLPEPRRQSRKTPNGILAKHESGRITQFREVTETLVKYMRNGPRKPTKFEQPVGERITEWMDMDAEKAGGEK